MKNHPVTRLRGVLSLIRIQSTPVTVSTLLLGYLLAGGSLRNPDVAHLVLVGCLGHWGSYALNDVFDYEYDIEQDRGGKPLVSGELNKTHALVLGVILSVGSLMLASLTENIMFITLFSLAYLAGLVYNKRSKSSELAALYLGGWGYLIVGAGVAYEWGLGSWNIPTVIVVSLLVGLHMVIMTVAGDMKDLPSGERSIPKSLGCSVVSKNGYELRQITVRFGVVAYFLKALQFILILVIPATDGFQTVDVFGLYAAVIGGFIWLPHYDMVMKQRPYQEDEITKDIAVYEITSVGTILAVCATLAPTLQIVYLIVATILWGTVWQTILYGHPFRFP